MAALSRLLLLVALLAAAVTARAATIVVDAGADPDSRLEMRRIVLPDGTVGELYVLSGDPVVVTVDDAQRIEGRLIEFDPQARVVRVVGPGSFEADGQRIEGLDLEIVLDDEQLSGADVLVVLQEIDVWGATGLRQPGQVDVGVALFSPCARCAGTGQTDDPATWDYGFRARSVRIYPGDRLIAEDVTVLVRSVPVATLPILVLPLAAGDRQPVLRIAQGTATARAVAELRWPYVTGRSGLGTLTVRYEADIDPTRPGGVAGWLLGGPPVASYVGGTLDHRFYTETGSGVLRVVSRPPAPDARFPGGQAPRRFTVLARYATAADLGLPSLSVQVARDDDRLPGRWEYAAAVAAEGEGVRGRFDVQSYLDTPALEAAGFDPLVAPSYADRVTPRRTLARLRLDPSTMERFRLGPARLDELEVDLGAFEDVANPANRRAAATPLSDGGRLRVRYALQVSTLPLWPGAGIEGSSTFEGRYYDTGERLVLWRVLVAFQQRLGTAGTFGVTFDRDVNEGETPFRFDTVPLRNRTDLTARLQLAPAPWIGFEASGGYTFVDTRRPELVGLQPLESRLRLFGDRSWIDVDVRHRADLGDGDPGALEIVTTLQGRSGPAEYRVQLTHLHDFGPTDVDGLAAADTRTAVSARAGVDALASVEVAVAHRPLPPPDAEGRRAVWEPLDLRVTLGSMVDGATRPGVRVQLLYDLDLGRTSRLQLDARAVFGPVEVDAMQRLELPDGGATASRLRVRWPGVAVAELQGAVLVPPASLGLEPGAPRPRTVSLLVRHLPLRDDPMWEATARTTYDPALLGGAGGRRDTALDLRVDLRQARLGASSLSLGATARVLVADDLLDRTHLQRASVILGADLFDRVGVQGSVSYVATYAPATGVFTRSDLLLDRVTLTVRATDQLFVGARVSDVWDFTGARADRTPWNLQPELFLLWDRCCWALAASWDTATGSVRVALAGPGGDGAVEQVFDTPLALPRRALPGDAAGGTP